ncbi:hypothetical protein HNQ80_004242 [Anaerosolibacter carboniphilus]|uniref:Uncharacterized protein n=1 Tax=Anaerosolibacter carboniphilus TaxID=1417629 RepID=A0A841L4R1_9FIRM|nr:hypothetical protein [Anaerosolibacter carboniphilus]
MTLRRTISKSTFKCPTIDLTAENTLKTLKFFIETSSPDE